VPQGRGDKLLVSLAAVTLFAVAAYAVVGRSVGDLLLEGYTRASRDCFLVIDRSIDTASCRIRLEYEIELRKRGIEPPVVGLR
jgi:hypothetical protein